jgi:hypothetical protein
MAVTTTVQDILDAAYAKSTKNQPGTIANEAVELLSVVARKLAGLYSFAARIDPTHFAVTANVVGSGSVWIKPEAAEVIFRIEDSADTEVVVVPIDDRLAADPKPALYEFGQTFIAESTQAAPPGATDTLTFWFSKRPDDPNPNDLTGVLDLSWDEAYNELLILEVALYLALKDGRADEVEMLKQERNTWAALFASHLANRIANLQRRFGHKSFVNVETLLPMLTGGA